MSEPTLAQMEEQDDLALERQIEDHYAGVIHERWVYWLEVGDRAALRTQHRPRVIAGEFDMRWWRGLKWHR